MEKISQIDLSDSFKENTIRYSYETFFRAFPLGGKGEMDGLKPIHRNILWTLWKHKALDYTKVSKLSGQCLEFHPHGDSSVYEAMVRMEQPWVMNYPYIDGQGNFADPSGSTKAAAGRYIEAKLSKFAIDVILNELDDVCVDYVDNFDYKSMVPKYLPSKIPLLLVNGISGIGVAFKCDVTPHNLNDVADRCIQYIKNKNITNEVLCDGFFPDFPTGGEILNGRELERFYKYGEPCTISIRGKYELDQNQNTIILTEFPYGVPSDNIANDVIEAIKNGNMILSGILEYQDNNHTEHNRDAKKKKNTTYEYKCKKEANMMEILNEMSKISNFRTTIQLSFMVNVGGYPKTVTVLDIIKDWYSVRVDCIRRRHQRNISIAQEKLHLYEGILSIYPRKEEVVKYLSSTKGGSKEEIIEDIHKKFKLTKTQSRGIYEMPLGTLSGFGEQDLQNRISNLRKNMLDDDYILTHIDQTIISELEELQSKYGRPRRTTIIMDYQEAKNSSPVVSKGVFLYSHNSLGLFDINGAKNNKGLLNGLRMFKGFGKGVREVCGGVGLEGTPKGFVVCYSDATVQLVESGVFRVLNVWYDTKCDEKNVSRMVTSACPYYSDEDEVVCLSDDMKIKRLSIKDISKRSVGCGGVIIKIARSNPNDEKIDVLMIGSASDKGATYSVVPLDDIPMLGRSASGVKCAYEKLDELDVFISLIDIGNSDEFSRFFVGTSDNEGQGYIHSIPISALKITGRTNKPKLLGLPKEQKATGLIVNKIDPKNKDQIISMIGKNSLSTLSISNFKKEFSFKRLFLNVIAGDVL